MKLNKFALLTAVAVSALGTAAQAQFAFPAADLHGTGATLPQNIITQSGNCYGLKADLGFGVSAPNAATPPISLFDFDFNTPVADTLGNRFNCAANSANASVVAPNFGVGRIVQPNVTVYYLSTGSGQGVTAFLNGRVSSNQNVSAGFANKAGDGDGYSAFDGYQYSASETALSSTNLTAYNTAVINPFSRYGTGTTDPVTGANSVPVGQTAANLFGPAIQIPFVIAPIAVAYAPVYAKERNNNVSFINTYRFTVGRARPDGSGGLKLTRAQYCGIFNGTITNWNQLPTSVVNKDINDVNLNWATTGVPIRLVGRSETSGTTSVFTRAMAAQCTGLSVNTGVNGTLPSTPIINKFGNSENRLPYDGVTTVANTAYTGAAGVVSPTNSLSGAFFDKATGVLNGLRAIGLFTVANGNDGVAAATNFHPDPAAVAGDRSFNGQIAYISPEQTLPAILFNGANGFGLNTANLQVNGVGATFVAPDAKQAQAAFAGTQPPQSKGTAGAYCTDVALCPAAYGDRANPLSWVQGSDKAVSQAAPVKGYPMIGTSNVLTYTCFATPARRQAINGYFATVVGKTTKDHNNQAFAVKHINDAVNGLFAKNGLAPVPGAWANAITETFLKKSTQVGVVGNATTQLGLRNLWIQDRIPTTPTGVASVTNGNTTVCAGKPGA